MPMDDAGKTRSGLSRRGFLKTVSAGAAATGLVRETTDTPVASAQEKAIVGPGPVPIKLDINGEAKSLSVEPRVTLLDALRNQLDITGAKKVCDRGTCGACTVLLDGKAIYACSMLAIEAQGHKITTIEGLGSPEKMSDVQSAFVKNDAQQCGFCTPGFVVACTAFVKQHPNASLDDVRDGLGGNLCRCGTYAGITEAVLQVVKGGA
ncbi:MAG TPA: (2Fe-2S)-binding protein [Candidatus Hydrogenedentes bacterium]|nr:(2Fe-2S)-binding protein [Candidatus Hydrogenedentota bacterium]